MASTSIPPAAGATERRSAHLRVGTAATAAFAALLLLLLVTHDSAEADRTLPSAAPATTEQPQQTAPSDPDPGFGRDRRGPGRRGGNGRPGFGRGGGIPGGGAPDGGGAAPVPVTPDPNAGGNTT